MKTSPCPKANTKIATASSDNSSTKSSISHNPTSAPSSRQVTASSTSKLARKYSPSKRYTSSKNVSVSADSKDWTTCSAWKSWTNSKLSSKHSPKYVRRRDQKIYFKKHTVHLKTWAPLLKGMKIRSAYSRKTTKVSAITSSLFSQK